MALSSSTAPGRVVRMIQDPVRGTLVVVATPGQKNRVFEADECSVYVVNIERSNTQVNEVWAMQGTTTLECPGLRGSVEFSGCH